LSDRIARSFVSVPTPARTCTSRSFRTAGLDTGGALPLDFDPVNIAWSNKGSPFLNEQSLRAANAFLNVASATTQPGELLDRPPAEIGKQAGLPNPLAVARAVRALAARKRLEVDDGRYRLIDARPLDPGEPESVPRAPRRRKPRRKSGAARAEGSSTDRR